MHHLLVRLCGLAALATVLAATALPASAQMRTERVRFTRGSSSATLRAEARVRRPVRYLVGVSAGQTLEATISDLNGSDCYVQVFAPGRATRPANAAPDASGDRDPIPSWTGRVSRAGDYQVLLTNRTNSGTCGLDVSVY